MKHTNPALENTLPPLPDPILVEEMTEASATEALEAEAGPLGRAPTRAAPFPHPGLRFRSLRHGCYLLRYAPSANRLLHYDGTLRVERAGFNTIASGDLYAHKKLVWPPLPAKEPSATKIPVFPRARYRYYMRVTKILEWITLGNSFTLGYDLYRYTATDPWTNPWTSEGSFTALMKWTTPPSGHPSGADYLTGDVKNRSGAVIGRITMAWVSSYLRRAVVEVDRVKVSELPEASGYEDSEGTDIDWRHAFRQVDWNVTVAESDGNIAEPSGDSWSMSELHKKMLQRRDSADLDSEWRYHLLCVRNLDATSRGIMYDAYGGDSNKIPREGAAISSHWQIPDAQKWGLVRNTRFGAAQAPYFRTAVHEIGHAMGLYHNASDNGFMNTTGVIASSGTATNPFPDNVEWSFNPDDAKLLRHLPDPAVRPGMIPYGGDRAPDLADMVAEVDGLELKVSALIETVPIGAPVRVDLELVNNSNHPIPVPESLSLKSGNVCGRVVDPSGTVRTFWPLVRCVDEDESETLAPTEKKSHSLTLLRGAQGALFSSSGAHQVIVDVNWHIDEVSVGVSGSGNVMVTPPVDEAHSRAALHVLTTPDALLTLVLGGDHLTEGMAAIQAALANPVLRPHYCVIEAKRLGKQAADVKKAAKLIDDKTVTSSAEVNSWAEIVKPVAGKAEYKALLEETEAMLKKRAQAFLAQKGLLAKADKS